MNKPIVFLLIFWACAFGSNAQRIYVSSEYDIWRLNPDDCSYSFVIHLNRGLDDMAFDTAGILYGISGNRLLKINPINGNYTTTTIFPEGHNAMTISAQNIVYVGSPNGELYSYDLDTGVQTDLGNMGYGAAGDFTFYKGEMYMTAQMNHLIKVNIQDPSLSSLVFSYTVAGSVLGIVSDFKNCGDIDCFAVASDGNGQSTIYRINFESNQLEYVCILDKYVGGGASTTEFMASIQIDVGTIIKTDANCQNQNGRIEIVNSSGHGEVAYSINGGPYQDTTVFNGLPAGSYWIRIIDHLGCQDSTLVMLKQALSPNIDSVFIQPSICNESNGQISILASGGSGALSYSLDSISFQSSPVFDHLPSQAYSVWIKDAVGCILQEDIQVGSLQSSQISSVETSATTCAENNGSIQVLVDNELGTEYSIDGVIFQINSFFPNLGAGSYLITIQDKDGCTDTISAMVAQSTNPEIEIVNLSPASCKAANGSLNMLGMQGLSPYRFAVDQSGFFNAGYFDSLSSGFHQALIIDQAGCLDSIEFQIPEGDLPTFESIEILSTTCLNANGSINAKIGGGVAPLVLSLYTDQQEKLDHFNSLSAGNYLLNVEDNAGCSVDSLVRVGSADCPIYIPNVFSPNGDGINDNFLIENLETGGTGASEILIFDRWGNLVYQQRNQGPSNSIGDWNGTFKGKQCPAGVYSYMIFLKRTDQEKELMKGEVTLIR